MAVPASVGVLSVSAVPAQALENGLARTPMMGFANWNSLGCNYDDAKMRSIADAMVSTGMKDAGYKYLLIQECIAKTRDTNGKIVPDPVKFPYGIKNLIDYIHSKGLLAGIYTDAGTTTCAGYVASYGHETADAQTFADWGVDLIEDDWCNVPSADFPGKTSAEIASILYGRMRDAITATGRPMVMYACSGWDFGTQPWTWGPNTANAWRSGRDIQWGGGLAEWDQIVANFDQNAEHPEATKPGATNDPDMMGVGIKGISDEEGRSEMSLWAMSAAPLMAGTDPSDTAGTFGAATKATYTNADVIKIDQDPLVYQARLVSEDASKKHQVWKKNLSNGDVAVALFNRDVAPVTMSTTATAVGLPASSTGYVVNDLWAHQSKLSAGTIAKSSVPGHGVALFRVHAGGDTTSGPAVSTVLTPSPGNWVAPGNTATVTATLTNNSPVGITNLTGTLTGPAGWTVGSPSAAVASVAAGGTGQVSWQVTSPSTGNAAPQTFTASLGFNYSGGSGTDPSQLPLIAAAGPSATNPATDTTTQGNWKGVYGGAGYRIPGDTTSLPAGITVTSTGTPFTWTGTTTDARALQKAGTGRIAAGEYGNGNKFSLTVTNTNADTRRIGLYLLDWDSGSTNPRQETVTITDSLGNVLTTVASGTFTGGKYLSWDIAGTVTFTVQSTAGANAVISGLFFGPPQAATATARQVNTTVQGNWKGTFGSSGYSVYGDSAQAAPGVQLTTVAGTAYTWDANPTPVRATQRGGTGRIAGSLYNNSAVKLRVNITDGSSKRVTLYLLDWDSTTRRETLTVTDTATGAVLDTFDPGSFANGTYVGWTVTGDVTITATRTAGANAVISATLID
ncbi:NEW3 domain-containing protein [Kitasatospora sp. NPDC057015]|uniref:NEW3 domain-containing protein n=1 Tax=Kitasatospora sp. NPDC057015 TaxID=3346001 RepID=UPI00363DCE00